MESRAANAPRRAWPEKSAAWRKDGGDGRLSIGQTACRRREGRLLLLRAPLVPALEGPRMHLENLGGARPIPLDLVQHAVDVAFFELPQTPPASHSRLDDLSL